MADPPILTWRSRLRARRDADDRRPGRWPPGRGPPHSGWRVGHTPVGRSRRLLLALTTYPLADATLDTPPAGTPGPRGSRCETWGRGALVTRRKTKDKRAPRTPPQNLSGSRLPC